MQSQVNRNIPFFMAAAAIAFLMALVASPAFARGARTGGGASMNMGISSQSNTHVSSQGMTNSNGVNASDRDTGTMRAEDRASANGLKHGHRFAKGHSTTDTDGDSR